jgi:hypothetical protein
VDIALQVIRPKGTKWRRGNINSTEKERVMKEKEAFVKKKILDVYL